MNGGKDDGRIYTKPGADGPLSEMQVLDAI